jgi:phosphoserine phosphatase
MSRARKFFLLSLEVMKSLSSADLIVFDMDGTLTPSKSAADREMIGLLLKLLDKKKVADNRRRKIYAFSRAACESLAKE